MEKTQKKDYQKTAYQYLDERTRNLGSNIAKNFYGRKITYDEFKEKISDVAKGFSGMGISEDSRVGVIMPNIPETSYIQYGLNKIGAVADYIDPRTKPVVLRDFVEKEKLDMLVCAKECYDGTIQPIEYDIKSMLKIGQILTPSSLESLPFSLKQLMSLKSRIAKLSEKSKQLGVIDKLDYSQFIKQSKYVTGVTADYVADRLAIITHSSGTTGTPKPIPLTNDNMNALVAQHDLLDLGIKPGMKFLHILPYFAAYGSVNSEHLGSCMGMEMLEIPIFNIEKLAELVLKTKPNIIIGIPSWWEVIIDSSCMKTANLSFLTVAVAGGDSLDPIKEQKINDFLIHHGAKCILSKGHGMSEIAGCGTYTTKECNNYGDVGKPLPFTKYLVVDPNTQHVIPFDGTKEITGEAYITGPALSPGKLDGKDVINTVYIDGERCVVSGDLITVRKDGSIHFEERLDRGFTRFDGYKIHPSKIEKCIMKHPAIKDCMIVNYYEELYYGNMPIIHVVLNDEYLDIDFETVINDIVFKNMQGDKELTTRDIPVKWKFRSSIPITSMSKKDYKKLISEGVSGDEYTIKIEEDNLKIKCMHIQKPEQNKKKVMK